ncbi:MAG: hypothetical protein RBR81_09530 [Bacteroidales bacterium]|jgi:hypothetical protein|nr:hypothetical protein [Bacteroidales bacterium]
MKRDKVVKKLKKDNLRMLFTKALPTILLLIIVQFTVRAGSFIADQEMSEQGDTVRKTIPYTLPWDDMPVDLSFVYAKEKPAGKHGFLTVDGDKFVFEDGTIARFWGTCFNSAQCFPSHEHSAKLAKRLGKVGMNIVRFHQMDAEWSTPNIFQFTKGENKSNTLSFDPVSIDRLDYLIYCLRQEGIYIHMDLLTYRRFKEGDGLKDAYLLDDAAKPYSTYNKKLIDLQKRYNYDIWTHINPYTGQAYKDDPAIVLVEVTNEADLFTQKATLEPYRSELEDRYRAWTQSKKIKLPKEKIDFTKSDKTMLQFFIDVTQDYYREMIQHMRETGVKIPITGTNWTRGVAHLSSQLVTDYTDSHAYTSGGGDWRDINGNFGNKPNIGGTNNMLPALAFNRVAGKPFFVSEWDNPWPNEWRAESSLLMASVGSLQGWGGFTIHTYRYGLDEDVDMIGKPITSRSIGNRAYRGGVFDTFNDPAKFGLFYHAALIIRRGDVKPSGKVTYIKTDDITSGPDLKALQLTPEQNRVEMIVPGIAPRASVISPETQAVNIESGEVISDTKELYRNLKKQIGWIDSPRTKAVYGFVGKEGTISLSNMKVNVKTDFATVAISSLTDDPIKSSANMLLTAVGRADNTDAVYNKERTLQIDPGHGPIQVEIIEAVIEIETDKVNLRVFSVNPQGFITGYIPSSYKDGVFRFEIGKEYQSMYYLIQSL